ncbi:MAG: hypothetical protein R6V39_11180 [Desulfovibrionales bacterium]
MSFLNKDKHFILDTEKGAVLFGRGMARLLSAQQLPDRELIYITDFFTSPGPGILELHGSSKYAEFLARKQLQDSGDLSEDLQVQILFTEKIDKQSCRVGYTLFTQEKSKALFELHRKSKRGFLLYDSAAAACEIYSNLKKNSPFALILHLPQALILAAGDQKNPTQLRRYALTGEEQIFLPDAITAIDADLRMLEQDMGISLPEVFWLEGLSSFDITQVELSWQRKTQFLPVQEYKFEDQTLYSGVGHVLDKLKLSRSLLPKNERKTYPLLRAEPWLWAIFLATGLFLAATTFYLRQTVQSLDIKETNLYREQTQLAEEMQSTLSRAEAEISDIKLEEDNIAGLAENLNQAQNAPSISSIWNMLSEIKPVHLNLKAWQVNFFDNHFEVRLEGEVLMEPDQAQRIFTEFIARLEKSGFVMLNKTLNLNLENNKFTLQTSKKFAEQIPQS